jgi:hypothetical protein
MSKLTNQLNARGLHNSWEFFQDQPYIGFRATQGYRDVIPSGWHVNKRGQILSDAWYDNGAKSFSCCGVASRKTALIEAQIWASEKFGIKEWARDPFGGYGDAKFIKQRIVKLLALPEKGQL